MVVILAFSFQYALNLKILLKKWRREAKVISVKQIFNLKNTKMQKNKQEVELSMSCKYGVYNWFKQIN